jgi:hypothetical protein
VGESGDPLDVQLDAGAHLAEDELLGDLAE